MTRLAKIIAASAAAAVGFTGVAVGVQASPVIVERVVDGDTIEVRMLDKTVRVRLLNIDAPETRDSGQPTECLGPEASEFLKIVSLSGLGSTCSMTKSATTSTAVPWQGCLSRAVW